MGSFEHVHEHEHEHAEEGGGPLLSFSNWCGIIGGARWLVDETVLEGKGREVARVSAGEWLQRLARTPDAVRGLLSFMSEDHRRARRFVVQQLVRTGAPIGAEEISRSLGLPSARVSKLLDDLERNLLFLVRDAAGAVTWAFPVTVDRTPHHLAFSSGERLWAA